MPWLSLFAGRSTLQHAAPGTHLIRRGSRKSERERKMFAVAALVMMAAMLRSSERTRAVAWFDMD